MQQNSELVVSLPGEDDEASPIVSKYELQSYENLFFALATDLKNERKRILDIKEEFWGGSTTRGELVQAKLIALEIAKIYVRLQPQLPTYGTNETTGKARRPSTIFTEVVLQTFKNFGLKDTDPRVPCEEAISKIETVNLGSP